MKRGRGLFILLSVIIFHALTVAAIGISPPRMKIDFAPNSELNFIVTLLNSGPESINATLVFEGQDAHLIAAKAEEYTILSPGSSLPVNVTLKFPAELEPGGHMITMLAKEGLRGGGRGISVFGEVSGEIHFFVPYPGTYARMNLIGKDAAENQPLDLLAVVENLGKYTIRTIIVYLETASERGEIQESVTKTIRDLAPAESKELTITLDPAKYSAGIYRAKAYAKYNAVKTNEEEVTFRVGTLFVNITNTSFVPYGGGVYKIMLRLQSRWNHPLSNVYATIDMYDNQNNKLETFKTPSVEIGPWEEVTISSFWSAKEREAGTYPATVTLYYGDQQTTASTTVTIEEQPSNLRPAMMTIIIVILIIIIDYIWLRKRSKKQEARLMTPDSGL